MLDYEIIRYYQAIHGANNTDACTALNLFREVEHEKHKSCAV